MPKLLQPAKRSIPFPIKEFSFNISRLQYQVYVHLDRILALRAPSPDSVLDFVSDQKNAKVFRYDSNLSTLYIVVLETPLKDKLLTQLIANASGLEVVNPKTVSLKQRTFPPHYIHTTILPHSQN